jgi:hypothetical protein
MSGMAINSNSIFPLTDDAFYEGQNDPDLCLLLTFYDLIATSDDCLKIHTLHRRAPPHL